MNPYELRLRAEWAALKAEEEGFTNTSDALLEIAKLHLSKIESAPERRLDLDTTNTSIRLGDTVRRNLVC